MLRSPHEPAPPALMRQQLPRSRHTPSKDHSIMQPEQTLSTAVSEFAAQANPSMSPVMEYAIDAFQRGALFLDVLRQRGNQYREQLSEPTPHVLDYEFALVMDGTTLPQPVNYALVRILPRDGMEVDETARPYVVIDPRAGHGPGIGGFKADSEIGVALRAGHPCYFIGFLPDPVPGQTIHDIIKAEAAFLEQVIALHPSADGKPCVVGNCQAGWALMMLAAIHPDLVGPLIVAGSPLSYWAGVHGANPMRYSGGLLGGSWLTAFASDLGDGRFDGAWLVQNFENQNPANTLWSKQYNLFAKIDTEASRYLGFERWWGGHVNLNAEEIQFIVDELFVGNKLAAGEIRADGTTIDLRNIRSPIIVFCSKGDNITPPQQALHWILDLYEDVDDIRHHGQTIVYTIHESVGHLGIFVSSSVARKEHGELSSNIGLIDTLPPGLYEAVFEDKTSSTENPDLATGDWVMRCYARTLDDLRALGGNDTTDERRFATAARVSEINLALYRTWLQPWVRAWINPTVAENVRRLHPLRLQYEVFSDANPMMQPIAALADQIRRDRKPAAVDNPFLALQQNVSNQIVAGFDAWRVASETWAEQTFRAVYGSPLLQAAVGIDPSDSTPQRKASKNPLHRQMLETRIAELQARLTEGGLREAIVRAIIYVGMARASIDERGFEMARRIRKENGDMSLSDFKQLVRDQFNMLLIDQDAALGAIPRMLPSEAAMRRKGYAVVERVLQARGELSADDRARLNEIARLFGVNRPDLLQRNGAKESLDRAS